MPNLYPECTCVPCVSHTHTVCIRVVFSPADRRERHPVDPVANDARISLPDFEATGSERKMKERERDSCWDSDAWTGSNLFSAIRSDATVSEKGICVSVRKSVACMHFFPPFIVSCGKGESLKLMHESSCSNRGPNGRKGEKRAVCMHTDEMMAEESPETAAVVVVVYRILHENSYDLFSSPYLTHERVRKRGEEREEKGWRRKLPVILWLWKKERRLTGSTSWKRQSDS